LRVTFDLSSGLAIYPPAVQTPDGRSFLMPEQADVFGVSVLVNSGAGVNTFTVRLFDGDRLLGTSAIPAQPLLNSRLPDYANFYFTSPASLLTGVNPVFIDFSSFNDGTINGLVEFTMDAGHIDRRGRFGVALFLGAGLACAAITGRRRTRSSRRR
jgi:hypothetical protein